MTKNRGQQASHRAAGEAVSGSRVSRGTLLVGLILLVFLGGFGALVSYDSRQNPGPPRAWRASRS